MFRGPDRKLVMPTLLALLLGAGCVDQTATTTSRPTARATHAAATSPQPGATATPFVLRSAAPTTLRQASPAPTPAKSDPPLAAPTAAPLPAVLAQSVALNAASGGFSPSTHNYLDLDAATASPPPGLHLSVSGADAASATANAYHVLGIGEADRHVAFRRWEAAHLTAPPDHFHYGVEALPATLKEGTLQNFFVITGFDPNAYQDTKVTAQLAKVGAHCYIFVDHDAKLSAGEQATMDARVKDIADTFDSGIYPTDTKIFGSEPNPGIDGDPHIFILLTPAVGNYGADGTLGYFSQRDETRPSVDLPAIYQHSNAKELLYISSKIVLTGSPEDYLGTIAHEFQHMINFNQKVTVAKNRQSEELWIDEGMAMYAIEANGYGLKTGGVVLSNHVKRFQESPEDFSLTDWNQNPEGIGYGPVYLFMVYLADRFNESFIHDIVTSKEIGAANLDHLLAKHGASFDNVFHDWTMANLLDGRAGNNNPRFQYQSLSMLGTTGKTTLSGVAIHPWTGTSQAVGLKPYSARYYEFARGTIKPTIGFTSTFGTGVQPRLVMP